jgi:hypothetical protein
VVKGYLWAPGQGLLDRVGFPAIRTFDSSRTPKRGERLAIPRTLAEVDLTAIVAALAAAENDDPRKTTEDRRRHIQLERELAAAKARIEMLEQENRELNSRLAEIAALAAGASRAPGNGAWRFLRAHSRSRPGSRAATLPSTRLTHSNVDHTDNTNTRKIPSRCHREPETASPAVAP